MEWYAGLVLVLTVAGLIGPFISSLLFFCCSWDTQCCAWCTRVLILIFQILHFLLVLYIGTLITTAWEAFDEFADEDINFIKTVQPAAIASACSVIFLLVGMIYTCVVSGDLKTMRENDVENPGQAPIAN